MTMTKGVLNRRSFLKLGGVALATCVIPGLWGCSSPSSDNANEPDPASSADASAADANASSHSKTAAADPATSSRGAAVVYFSCTGNTKAVAEKIAQATGGSLEEIIPAVPYTADDLDYNSDCRANAEQQGGAPLPEIANPVPNITNAGIIYLGYPIWWGKAPRIILSFLEQADTAGKTIIPFCTSGGSPISGSLAELEAAAPNATFMDGERFSSSVTQEAVDDWIASIQQ